MESGCERRGGLLVGASMLFMTTAQPTALAEAGTSYSHIAVRIGNNFIELEINNVVETIFPFPINMKQGILELKGNRIYV